MEAKVSRYTFYLAHNLYHRLLPALLFLSVTFTYFPSICYNRPVKPLEQQGQLEHQQVQRLNRFAFNTSTALSRNHYYFSIGRENSSFN